MENWQYDLTAAQQSTKTIGANDYPNWVNNLTLAQQYTANIDELLTKLPMMMDVTSQPARQAYFDSVVKELIRLAYVQARIAQLSNQSIKPDVGATAQRIQQLSHWLRL